jgi:hypothetical protein
MAFHIKLCYHPHAKPNALVSVLEWVSDKTGMTTHEVGLIASYVFERIAIEVSLGRTVMIPGFGKFGAWAYTPTPRKQKYWHHQRDPFCLPRFSAAQAWKNEVMSTAVPSDDRNKEMDSYRRNHSTTIVRPLGRERPDTALEEFRTRLRADARRNRVPIREALSAS